MLITIIILSLLLVVSLSFLIYYYKKIIKIRKVLIEHKIDFIDIDKMLDVQDKQLNILNKILINNKTNSQTYNKIIKMMEYNINYNKILLYTFKNRIKEKK